jgi:hypothetical protein
VKAHVGLKKSKACRAFFLSLNPRFGDCGANQSRQQKSVAYKNKVWLIKIKGE